MSMGWTKDIVGAWPLRDPQKIIPLPTILNNEISNFVLKSFCENTISEQTHFSLKLCFGNIVPKQKFEISIIKIMF